MQGVDVLDAEKMTVNQRIRKGLENVDVPSLLALQDGSVWAATYGRGFVRLKKGTLAYKLDREQMDNEVPFPRPAQMEEPSVVLRRLERLGSDAHAGKNIVFRGGLDYKRGLVREVRAHACHAVRHECPHEQFRIQSQAY